MTCKHARGFLESAGGSVAAVSDAKKVRIGPAEVLALARKMDRVVAMRGKRVVTFNLEDDRPGDEALLGALIGPSGNLRAPAAVVGRTLIVGFNEGAYRRILNI